MRLPRLLLLAVVLALVGSAAGQQFTVAARASLDGLSAQGTLEVRAYELGDIRVAPVVTATVAWRDWSEVEASVLAGIAATWLPPDSTLAIQLQVHYRVLWTHGAGARAGPELYLGVVGSLW